MKVYRGYPWHSHEYFLDYVWKMVQDEVGLVAEVMEPMVLARVRVMRVKSPILTTLIVPS